MQEALPRLWTNRVTEQCFVVAFFETIAAAVLLIGIADRQIIDRGKSIVDNGVITHSRTYDLVSSLERNCEQVLKMLTLHNNLSIDV